MPVRNRRTVEEALDRCLRAARGRARESTNLQTPMAQTKKKRRTKHRGNAAGVVEARGRTGRKPTAEERKRREGGGAAQARRDRLEPAADLALGAPTARRSRRSSSASLLILLFKTEPVAARSR